MDEIIAIASLIAPTIILSSAIFFDGKIGRARKEKQQEERRQVQKRQREQEKANYEEAQKHVYESGERLHGTEERLREIEERLRGSEERLQATAGSLNLLDFMQVDEAANSARSELQFLSGHIHIAVCGVSGVGKSSLINAVRGLTDYSEFAAPVGEQSPTKTIGRYCDSKSPWSAWNHIPRTPWHEIWYDIPAIRAAEMALNYYSDQKLWCFDAIVVVVDGNHFPYQSSIVKILEYGRAQGVRIFLVCSMIDYHVQKRCTSPSGILENTVEFIESMRRSTQQRLEEDALFGIPIYLVSKDNMLSAALGNYPPADPTFSADERRFIRDIETTTKVHTEHNWRLSSCF